MFSVISRRARAEIFHSSLRKMSSNRSKFLIPNAYINGEWVSTDDKFEVRNPATGEVIGHTSSCGEKETNAAIDAAKEAFKTWSFTTAKSRSNLIRKLYELQMKYRQELAEVITIEMGKPVSEAMGEINYGASFFEWFSEEARRINGEILQSPFTDKMIMYTKEPIGPVGIIVPVSSRSSY